MPKRRRRTETPPEREASQTLRTSRVRDVSRSDSDETSTPSPARRSRSRKRRSQSNGRRSRSRERRTDEGAKKRKRSKVSKSKLHASKSSKRRRRRRSASSQSETDTRYLETQNSFFEKFINAMKDVKGNNERDKFPVLNNVIPEFDPLCKEQSVDVWIHKIEECAQIYNWDDKHVIHYALPKLGGVAKTWYQGLPTLLFSWEEWKVKLRESFPSKSNYADLLTEMLNKRARYGDSLELYYYAKINLLNRCEIVGLRAVDCLIAGIDDRGARLGAQAAEFTEPEQVLKFLKTIKVGQDRNTIDTTRNRDKDRRPLTQTSSATVNNNKLNTNDKSKFSNITCFNCNETGHPFFKCPKPRVQCTICNLRGHVASDCKKPKPGNGENSTKSVLRVESTGTSSLKYRMPIKINEKFVDCQVDLGSEGTLIRRSEAEHLGLEWNTVTGPLLKGLGNIPYRPIGKIMATVDVQGVTERDVEILVVDDALINSPVLLGHTYTERPGVKIVKTGIDVIFQKSEECVVVKYPLICTENTNVSKGELKVIPIKMDHEYTGQIYVNGTIRGCADKVYYMLPGEYEIRQGIGGIFIQNIGSQDVEFHQGHLITRSHSVSKSLQINNVKFTEDSDESTLKHGDNLSSEQLDALKRLLKKYETCFSASLQDLGYTTETEMMIHLKDTEPVVYRPYRMSYPERLAVREMIKDMLDSNIIRESSSPYASPIVLVNKKTGEKRLCVDYRKLNDKTNREHYPMPRIEDQLDMLSGSSLYISLDLASGYYQIPIAEESREKTAFVTMDGQYEYNRMPFGLVNAPSVFQRTMNKIIQKSTVRSYVLVYMDDILIPASSFEEGLTRLEEVLTVLRESGLTLKLSKCNFFFEKIDYLGYEVSAEGIRPGSFKTEAISRFPEPTNVHEVRRFIGLASFFRRFVRGFASVARPLTALLKKDAKWGWGAEESAAFKKLKQNLVERPILAIYNPHAETQLHTDASKFGIAGILLQKNDSGLFKPIAYYSRQTTVDEQKLHSFELETLAIIASLNKFRVYLLGVKFKIITDCNALRTTLVKRDLVPRIARWWVQFMEFDCEIEYRAGERMAHVDALSRAAIEGDTSDNHVMDVLTINNEDWLITVQQSDDDIKRIAAILNDGKTREVVDVFNNYEIKNGRVFRKIDKDTSRWVVPKGARWQILRNNHDDIGHFGYDKTLARIKANYWFPKMRRFIKKYVRACLECAHHKMPSGAKVGELHPIPKSDLPFHTIHADHLGPFIRTKRGNTYILVIVDAFTKFVNLSAVRNTKSSSSIRVFREHFSYFGTPTRLITDQGSSFTSNTFKAFIQSTGIKHVYNAVATPRANGQVERYNRTILAALGAMNHDKPNGLWDEHLPDIQLGINTTIHATTKKTPTELLFGRNVTNPSQGKLNEIITEITPETTESTLDEVRAAANELIKTQQEKDKDKFDKQRKTNVKFSEGDLVRVIRSTPGIEGQSKKLEPKLQGPYKIIKVLPHDRFVIEDTPLTRKGRRYEAIVAIDKIFPWLTFGKPASDTDGSLDDEEDE